MDPRCQECGAAVRHQPGQSVPRTETVWCCLLCGFQGCDRYGKQHALEHARTRGHNYCIDLQSQRIWDYEGDCFVHRLIYNRAECQLEYLPDAHDGAPPPMGKELVDAKLDAKVEAITTEYTHMLTNQMEEQRRVYLALLASQRKRHGETLCTTKADLELLHTGQLRELQALKMARRAKAEREEHAASARRVAQELTDKIRRLEESNRMAMTQRDELKAEILSFATSQKASKDKATALVKDLQQEIADLEGHFRALAMVEKHELKGDIGRGIIIPTGPVCGSGKRKGRSGRR
jgi:BRCA1-associated protein